MRSYLFRVVYASLVGLGVFAAGCSNNHSTSTAASDVTVSVAPNSATVGFNQTQQFTATVDQTSNTAVTWEVNGIAGGSAAFGAIDNTGLYTAPASAPNTRGTVVVEAVSQADPTKVGAATVGIGLSVSIAPPSPVIQTGTAQQFNATVNGSSDPISPAVSWSVNNNPGGNSTIGTIDSDGNYTAPSSISSDPQQFEIEATSFIDPSAVGTTNVTVTKTPPSSIVVSPPNPQVLINTPQQFTATVNPAGSNQSVTWSLTGQSCPSSCGTIDANGLYTAPASVPSPATVTVIATSTVNPQLQGSTTITITQMTITISPNPLQVNDLSLTPGSTLSIFATVNNAPSTPTITWTRGCINAFESDQLNEEHCGPDTDGDKDGTGFIVGSGGSDPTVTGANITYTPPTHVNYTATDTNGCPPANGGANPPFAYVALSVTATASGQVASAQVCIQVSGN